MVASPSVMVRSSDFRERTSACSGWCSATSCSAQLEDGQIKCWCYADGFIGVKGKRSMLFKQRSELRLAGDNATSSEHATLQEKSMRL